MAPAGRCETADGAGVVYDVGRDEALFGAARVDGPRSSGSSAGARDDALLSAESSSIRSLEWLVRCDRVDFPPGGVAYRHTHPGPGIRACSPARSGSRPEGRSTTHGPLDAWFESGPEPVFAAASATEETAFVRVMLLPREWEGKRTIRYVDPADAEKPKTQRASILLERHVELP